MINRVVLMGRLTADPELKTTQSGLSVTSFRLAVDRNYTKQGQEKQADFINIVCWRQTAEFVCRYFGKGSMIALDGRIQTRQYQANDGSNRVAVEVVADSVSFTGERRDDGGQGSYGGNYQNNYQAPPQQNYGQMPQNNRPRQRQNYDPNYDFADVPSDDDLPF